tara:strand:+ start:8103 stop:8564 length:462 start_codon:yes stop_codon:yes gene_type:complete
MLLIAHRGNLKGPNPSKENHPDYLKKAIDKGYNVEADLWFIDNTWVLGHDNPEYEISFDFINNFHMQTYCWYHTKNLEALQELSLGQKYRDWKYFWHDQDDYTLTSNKKIWTFPKKDVTLNCIIVCQNKKDTKEMIKKKIFGVCSDFVDEVKK